MHGTRSQSPSCTALDYLALGLGPYALPGRELVVHAADGQDSL